MSNNYKELKELLIKANSDYYVSGNPVMSDYAYDMKLKELEQMERDQGFADPDSPTQKPGSDLTETYRKNTNLVLNNADNSTNEHGRPMLSLENTYNADDVTKWINNLHEWTGTPTNKLEIFIQEKFDGGSAAIRFVNGAVVKALTRGNGLIGEDITDNVKLLDWSKINKTFTGEVRGELIITKSGFKILNKSNQYQNARNLLSGSMKLLEHSEFKKRAACIKFYAYWLEDSNTTTYSDDMKILKDNGFDTGTCVLAIGLDQTTSEVSKIEKNKLNYDYDIDGAVMKLNNKSFWNSIGSTAKFPRWAKAYKFHQDEATTKIVSIEYQVGRTGKITPVANLSPVFIDGTTISRVTLNNEDYISAMDLRVGDTVSVHKAAAIIPEIVSVVSHAVGSTKTKFISVCPCCGTKLVRNIGEADTYCTNQKCKSRIIDKLSYYTHQMEIDGLSDATLLQLNEKLGVDSIESLYETFNIKNKDMVCSKLDSFKDKSFMNIHDQLENSKHKNLASVIAALGISGVGTKVAKELVKEFKSISNIEAATVVKITNISGFGDIMANDIVAWFADEENKKILNYLKSIDVIDESQIATIGTTTVSKTVCITGALSKPRKEIISELEAIGWNVTDSVSSKTDYLVTNDTTSGSSKNEKAKKLGISILSEADLYKIIGEYK